MYKKITKIVSINLKKLWILVKKVFKITKTMTRILANVFAIIIAISMLIYLVNTILSADEVAKENEQLLAEFKMIQHPINSVVIDPKEKISRGPLYTAEFRYNLSDEKVEGYYDQELKKHGWVKEAKKYDNNYKGFSYVKDRNIIAIFKSKNTIKIDGAWDISLYYQARVK